MSAPPAKRRRWRILFVLFMILFLLGAVAYHWAHLWLPGAVDVARQVPGVGFGRMHRVERVVLGGVDALHNLGTEPATRRALVPPPEDLSGLWPPVPLLPVLGAPGEDPDEGLWVEASSSCWEGRAVGGVQRTRLRVDPARPEIYTEIVAVDLRQVRLEFLPGTARDAQGATLVDADDVLATFHGGFQAEHGGFGMGWRDEVMLAPVAGLATLAEDQGGALWLGALGDPTEFAPPWFRQNLPLLQDGQVVRGDMTLMAHGRQEHIGHSPTRRAGLCLRAPHTMMFFWTLRAQATSLAEAMVVAGCDRGMHLDANAFHTGWEFVDLRRANQDAGGGWSQFCAERLHPRMTDRPLGRHLQPQARDFFVLRARSAPLAAPIREAPP